MNRCIDRRRFLGIAGALGAGLARVPTTHAGAAGAGRGAPTAERLGWRLACNAYTYNKLTFHETIGKVAGLGLKYIVGFNWQKLDPSRPETVFGERMTPADRAETRRRLADAGLKLTGCYCRDLSAEPIARQVFDFAREMGIETLVGEPPVEAFDMLEKLCAEFSLDLAVHNHAKPSKYWQPETLLDLFKGRSRRIGACCDTGHWIRSELPVVETLARFQGRVLTFDLKDIGEDGSCVPFGTGKGNTRALLGELRRQGFRGVLGIEYGQRRPNAEQEIAQCVAFIEQVSRDLAGPGAPGA